ncbi:metallophosphoesterase [Rapidithrix thailandica]|uniref:Metallophosphoesterase n=1 Tax=Rapidithrix thailandica TaxID=413964 RepID=A0AAW9SAY0_9BACT
MYLTLVGDVHGCYHTLLTLLERIPRENNQIILMGDLINKGPYSYEVFKWVRKEGVEFILGNHEYLCMLRNQERYQKLWRKQGGQATLASIDRHYAFKNGKHVQVILAQMAYFFATQRKYHLIPTAYGKTFIVTHGGISKRLFRQQNYSLERCLNADVLTPNSYLFNKQKLLSLEGYIQVIGHQPKAYAPLKVRENYYLDSGCVYTQRPGMGYLSALMFNLQEEEPPRVFKQQNLDC